MAVPSVLVTIGGHKIVLQCVLPICLNDNKSDYYYYFPVKIGLIRGVGGVPDFIF